MVHYSQRVFWAASVMLTVSLLSGPSHAANTMQLGQFENSQGVIEEASWHNNASVCVNQRYSFDANELFVSPEVPYARDLQLACRRGHKEGMDGVEDVKSGVGTGSEFYQERCGGCTFSSCPNSSVDSPVQTDSFSWQSFCSFIFCFLFLIIIYLIMSILKKTDPIPSDKRNTPETQPATRRGFKENKLLLEIDAPISQGRESIVYRGTYCRTAVAVKFSHKMGTSADASEEPLEAKHLRMLRHPSIVALVVSGSYLQPHSKSRRASSQMSYDTFIAMEFCDRGSLHQLTKGFMNVDMVMTSALEIARAMRHMHSKRVIHGCLHSKHIFLQSSSADPRGFTCKASSATYSSTLKSMTVGRRTWQRRAFISWMSLGDEPSISAVFLLCS